MCDKPICCIHNFVASLLYPTDYSVWSWLVVILIGSPYFMDLCNLAMSHD